MPCFWTWCCSLLSLRNDVGDDTGDDDNDDGGGGGSVIYSLSTDCKKKKCNFHGWKHFLKGGFIEP